MAACHQNDWREPKFIETVPGVWLPVQGPCPIHSTTDIDIPRHPVNGLRTAFDSGWPNQATVD